MEGAERGTSGDGQVVVVANLEGGVGKTTLAVDPACAMAVSGHRSCVLDADPQASAAGWTSRRRLPAAVERALFPEDDIAGDWLARLAALRTRYDRLVVDLPAVLGPVTGAALLVADLVLIPTSLSELDVRATARTVARVARARRERPDRPLPALIVPNRVAAGFGVAQRVRRALGRLGEEIAPFLRADPVWAEAVREADWVGSTSRLSRARRDLFALHAAVEDRLAGDAVPVAATAGISSAEPLPAR